MNRLDIELFSTRRRYALGKGGAPLNMKTIAETIQELHPSDIAAVLDELILPEAQAVFALLSNDHAAEVLDEVAPDTQRYLVEHSARPRIVYLLDILPMDDVARVVSEVGEQEAGTPLADLAPKDAQEVKDLLNHPEHSAGRLMTDRFAYVETQTTAGKALEYLRRARLGNSKRHLYGQPCEAVARAIVIVFRVSRPHPVQPISLNSKLHTALEHKDATTVERLLSQGADPNAELPADHPALVCAVEQGDAENVLLLIWYGAEVNRKDPADKPALTYAIEASRTERQCCLETREGEGIVVRVRLSDTISLRFSYSD